MQPYIDIEHWLYKVNGSDPYRRSVHTHNLHMIDRVALVITISRSTNNQANVIQDAANGNKREKYRNQSWPPTTSVINLFLIIYLWKICANYLSCQSAKANKREVFTLSRLQFSSSALPLSSIHNRMYKCNNSFASTQALTGLEIN